MFLECVGFKLEFVMIDVLHTVDLGVASHVLGNIFWEVMQLGVWGSNQADQVKGLSLDIDAW